MSVVLSLDLSTRAGWAIFKDCKLFTYGVFEHKAKGDFKAAEYPMNYYENAKAMAHDINDIIRDYSPAHIVIEQVTLGKSIHHQKMLEWIHFAVIDRCPVPVHYMAVSTWRAVLSISLTPEQRKMNNKIKKQREEMKLKCQQDIAQEKREELSESLKRAKNKREEASIKKKFQTRVKKAAAKRAGSSKVMIDGERQSIVSAKNSSVDYVNRKYGLNLIKKDNDKADAICIGEAFIKKFIQ